MRVVTRICGALTCALFLGPPAHAQYAYGPPAGKSDSLFAVYNGVRSKATAGRSGLPALNLAAVRPSRVPGRWVVRYADGGARKAAVMAPGRLQFRVTNDVPRLHAQVVECDEASAAALRAQPGVLSVAPQLFRYPLVASPNDPAYNTLDSLLPSDPANATWYKWDTHMIYAVDGWDIWPNQYFTGAGKGAAGVPIAVVDTGIDYGHPDFINSGGTATDVAHGGQLLRHLDKSIFSGIMTDEAPDGYGHGTHVAGIAAAATNNGVGTVGTGYNANVISVRVVDANGNATDSDIAQGIVYAVDAGATVLNLSLGSYEYSQVEQDAVNYAWRKGALVVAAAGNDGSDRMNYPGGCSKVLAVSAVSRISLATYSNYGNMVGICAPGGDFDFQLEWFLGVYSTMPTYDVTLNNPDVYGASHDYEYLQGTSMAAPHVVGTVALYAGQQGIVQGTPGGALRMLQAVQRGAGDVTGTGGWSPHFGWGISFPYDTLNLDSNPNPRVETVGCILGQVLYRGTPVLNASVVAKPVSGSSFSGSSRADGGYRIPNLPVGTYAVTATYFGETQKINVVVSAGCDVPGADFNIAAYPSSVTVEPASGAAGSPTTLTGLLVRNDTGAPLEDMSVDFAVDGTLVGAATTSALGAASLTYDVPAGAASGDHAVSITFHGWGPYLPSTGSGVLSLPTAGSSIYTIDRTGIVGTTALLRAYLRRQTDQTALVGRTVLFEIDGSPAGPAVTDANGRATYGWVISSAAGTHPITARFAGDSTYQGSSGSAVLTATTESTKTYTLDRSGKIKTSVLLKGYLYDHLNALLPGRLLTFKLDGVALGTIATNSVGRAELWLVVPEGSGAGMRTISAEFAGYGGYLQSSDTAVLTVQTGTLTIWPYTRTAVRGQVHVLKSLIRSLPDYAVQPGKSVTMRIDGTAVGTVSADATGWAAYAWSVPVDATVGAHAWSTEFTGDAWYAATTKTVSFNVIAP